MATGEGDRLPDGVPGMPVPGGPDVFARLDRLGESLAGVAASLAEVAKSAQETRALAMRVDAYSRRTRRLTTGLIISLVLDVTLTVVVTLLSISALDQGSALHGSQVAACAISNQTRVEQEQLWTYILQDAAPPKTAAQKAADDKFLAHVRATFAPVNCTAVYAG